MEEQKKIYSTLALTHFCFGLKWDYIYSLSNAFVILEWKIEKVKALPQHFPDVFEVNVTSILVPNVSNLLLPR